MVFLDMTKAFHRIYRSLLWKILRDRAKTNQEKLIVRFIVNLHSSNIIRVGEEEFLANRGVPQGGVLSPLLFNLYLDYCIKQIPILKNATRNNQLMAFADDILLRAAKKEDAEQLIKGVEELRRFGLDLNR